MNRNLIINNNKEVKNVNDIFKMVEFNDTFKFDNQDMKNVLWLGNKKNVINLKFNLNNINYELYYDKNSSKTPLFLVDNKEQNISLNEVKNIINNVTSAINENDFKYEGQYKEIVKGIKSVKDVVLSDKRIFDDITFFIEDEYRNPIEVRIDLETLKEDKFTIELHDYDFKLAQIEDISTKELSQIILNKTFLTNLREDERKKQAFNILSDEKLNENSFDYRKIHEPIFQVFQHSYITNVYFYNESSVIKNYLMDKDNLRKISEKIDNVSEKLNVTLYNPDSIIKLSNNKHLFCKEIDGKFIVSTLRKDEAGNISILNVQDIKNKDEYLKKIEKNIEQIFNASELAQDYEKLHERENIAIHTKDSNQASILDYKLILNKMGVRIARNDVLRNLFLLLSPKVKVNKVKVSSKDISELSKKLKCSSQLIAMQFNKLIKNPNAVIKNPDGTYTLIGDAFLVNGKEETLYLNISPKKLTKAEFKDLKKSFSGSINDSSHFMYVRNEKHLRYTTKNEKGKTINTVVKNPIADFYQRDFIKNKGKLEDIDALHELESQKFEKQYRTQQLSSDLIPSDTTDLKDIFRVKYENNQKNTYQSIQMDKYMENKFSLDEIFKIYNFDVNKEKNKREERVEEKSLKSVVARSL